MVIVQLTTDNREPFRQYDRPEPWFGAAPEALLQGFAQFPEVTVHVISCAQRPMISSPEKIADNIWFHSLHVRKTGWLRTFYQGCAKAVRRKVAEIRPDIVHGQGTERECAISAVFSSVPNVITIHGNMAELSRLFCARIGSYDWLAARLEGFALKRTAGVFCNSNYTESLVRSRTRRIWRVPNALRKVFFEPIPRRGPVRRAIMLNVGVISRRKRQLEFLGVAEKLHRLGLEFQFQFIGDADLRDPYVAAFFERLRPLEKDKRAMYSPRLATAELITRFNSASGFVHFPSEEAFGLVVAEALARDLKFFGSRVGGIIDIAQAVPGAQLFGQNDWDGLTQAIAKWIQEGCVAPEGCSALMLQQYHPAVIARRHLEIYRELLSTRS